MTDKDLLTRPTYVLMALAAAESEQASVITDESNAYGRISME